MQLTGTYMIVNVETKATVACVSAPQDTAPSEIVHKFVNGQGMGSDEPLVQARAEAKFRADWCPLINWFGNLNDVDTAFCELGDKWYVGVQMPDGRARMISGPHDEQPVIVEGQILCKRSSDGETIEQVRWYDVGLD
tara:strand:- start:255 stop:665 length:411 start_codon:yes stop_codon:yes gene_type:complete